MMYEAFRRYTNMPLLEYRLCVFAALIFVTYVSPGFITGVLWGLYAATFLFFYICVSEPLPQTEKRLDEYNDLLEKVKEQCDREERSTQEIIYRGWMNLYDDHYSPNTFHVNLVQTVLVRLEGKMLRISKPDRVMLKHGFHLDPTLIENEPRMISQQIYDLTNATVKLRPRDLARRRWFSRKYPICIKLSPTNNDFPSNDRECTSMSDVLEMREDEYVVVDDSTDKSESEHSFPPLTRRATTTGVEGTVDNISPDAKEESEDELFVPRPASEVHLKSSSSLINQARKSSSTKNSFHPSRTIYLFARCSREKERWFHRLRRSCYRFTISKDLYSSLPNRRFSLSSRQTLDQNLSNNYFHYIIHALQFNKHLKEILNTEKLTSNKHNDTIFMDLGRTKWSESTETSSSDLVLVANLLFSRVFYDFCRDNHWRKVVQTKIQTKLATIHLPQFIEALELSSFDIGTAIPFIEKIYEPVVNEWGIWADFEIKYDGLIKLVLETRVNLMRMKERHESSDYPSNPAPRDANGVRPVSKYSDEEIPESPETSPDEDFGSKPKSGKEKRMRGKRVLSLIDRVTNSKLFEEASKLKPIRKMMEEVSSTRLMLNVEITKLEGIMTVNLAPPPSDRLWYSFRKPPQMSIRAVPQIGDRTVVFSTLSDWIEKKIIQLLEKNLVVPNMDDVVLPVTNELLENLSK